MPEAKIRELLRDEAGLDDEQVDQCLALAAISTEDESFADQVRALGVTHTLLDEGLDELSALVRACAPLADDRVRIRAELKIARGLDYYPGPDLETRLDGYDNLGPICRSEALPGGKGRGRPSKYRWAPDQ